MRGIFTFLFSLLLIIVVLGLGLPWLDGYLFKKNYFNTIAAINRDKELQIDVVKYDTGWLHSYAKLRVIPLDENKVANPTLGFMVENNISHGPIIYDRSDGSIKFGLAKMRSYFHLPEKFNVYLKQNSMKEGVMQIITYAHFNGDWKNKIHIPLLAMQIPDFGKVTWQGLNGTILIGVKDQRINKTKSNVKAGAVTVDVNAANAPITQLVMQAFTYDTDAFILPNGLWSGTSNFVIPSILIKLSDAKNIAATNLTFKSQMGLNSANLYDFKAKLALASLEIPIGPINNIAPLEWSVDLSNLSPQALSQLIVVAQKMKEGNQSRDNAQAFISLVPSIITPTTTLSTNKYIHTSLGDLISDLKLFWKGSTQSFPDLMANLNFTFNVKGSVALVDQLISVYSTQFSQAMSPPVAETTPVMPARSEVDSFDETVAMLLRQGKISMEQSMQLIGYRDKGISLEEFTRNVTALQMDPTLQTQLTSAYQTQLANDQAMQKQIAAKQTNQAAQPGSNLVTMTFQSWLQQGYILKQGNDYIVEIKRDNGVFTVNGKIFSPENLPLPITQH